MDSWMYEDMVVVSAVASQQEGCRLHLQSWGLTLYLCLSESYVHIIQSVTA